MIAVIPARGGSKGLPGKNIKPLNGKPLIAYTIEAAKNASGIERVIVSTDDNEIAKVAKQYGAEVPFRRPEGLSGDTASAVDVYLHVIDYLSEKESLQIDKFMVLLPTAPLRTSQHIEEALDTFQKTSATTLISMTEAETPPSWYYLLNTDGTVANAGLGDANPIANRQNNKTYLIPNGAIYILDAGLLREERTYYAERTVPYIMSKECSIDIDTLYDFKLAEFLVSR